MIGAGVHDAVLVHARPNVHTVYGVEISLRDGVTYDDVVAAIADLPMARRRTNELIAYLSEDLALCDRVADRNIYTTFNRSQS